MANLIAGKKVVEELIQHDVTPHRIREELERVLGSERVAQRMRTSLAAVRERLALTDDVGGTVRTETTGRRVAKLFEQLIDAPVGSEGLTGGRSETSAAVGSRERVP
jgi:lipid A disaccharide synthetase